MNFFQQKTCNALANKRLRECLERRNDWHKTRNSVFYQVQNGVLLRNG